MKYVHKQLPRTTYVICILETYCSEVSALERPAVTDADSKKMPVLMIFKACKGTWTCSKKWDIF